MRNARSALLGPATFALLLLVRGTAPLEAQTIPSPFRYIETRHTVGLFAGWLATNTGNLDLAPEPAPIVGVRYDLRLSGPALAEVSVGFSPSERTIFVASGADPGDPLEAVDTASLVTMIADVGIRFNITGPRSWRGLTPYAVVTAGMVVDLADPPAIESQIPENERFEFGPGFAAGFGLGTDVFLSERFSLRVDARDHLWRLTNPAGLAPQRQEEKEWVHNFSFTLGGSVHF